MSDPRSADQTGLRAALLVAEFRAQKCAGSFPPAEPWMVWCCTARRTQSSFELPAHHGSPLRLRLLLPVTVTHRFRTPSSPSIASSSSYSLSRCLRVSAALMRSSAQAFFARSCFHSSPWTARANAWSQNAICGRREVLRSDEAAPAEEDGVDALFLERRECGRRPRLALRRADADRARLAGLDMRQHVRGRPHQHVDVAAQHRSRAVAARFLDDDLGLLRVGAGGLEDHADDDVIVVARGRREGEAQRRRVLPDVLNQRLAGGDRRIGTHRDQNVFAQQDAERSEVGVVQLADAEQRGWSPSSAKTWR